MKCLKINVETQQIEEIEYSGNFREIYGIIGNECSTFACPVTLDNEDTIYCDDEGIFKPNIGGWKFADFDYQLVGNAVLMGADDEGESVDVKTSKEELEAMVIWIDKPTTQKYLNIFI